jgi:hypothetical protein
MGREGETVHGIAYIEREVLIKEVTYYSSG